jgi:hypothetical protein
VRAQRGAVRGRRLAFLAYWDSGFIAVDVTDPAHPIFRGRTDYPANADGDGHSWNYDEARSLLFTDEDFCKTSGSGTEKGYGYLRVYDYRDREVAHLVPPRTNTRSARHSAASSTTRRRYGAWAVDEASGLVYLSDIELRAVDRATH